MGEETDYGEWLAFTFNCKDAALDKAVALYGNKPQHDIIKAAEAFERFFMADCKADEAQVIPFGNRQ